VVSVLIIASLAVCMHTWFPALSGSCRVRPRSARRLSVSRSGENKDTSV
jgi:hypothetical protein